MAVDGRLNFDTKIDTKGFNNGTKNITNSLGGLKSALGKVAVAAAAAFSVKKLVDFGKQSIETASDMAEVQNVVDTAFGSMSDKMEEFANNSIKQFGISKLAAKQTGSTFMAMASGMGLAQDNASDMAIALTGLSADMASFYNVSQDVASTALKSIFTGETETLKQFGIVMTDANLQAYALSQGINKSTQNMSQAEKVQLRYNYVMQQTSLAQGDFAKTQDSWANQTRILSEQWKEFGATIGSLLMNVFLPALKTLNNVLSQLISYANAAVKALSNVFGIKLDSGSGGSSTGAMASDTARLADDSSQAADNYSDMADSAKKAQKANEKSLASFDKINKLNDSSDNSTSSAVTSPANTGASLAGKQGSISVKADVSTSDAEKKITDFLNRTKQNLSTLFAPLQSAWDKYGGAFVTSAKNALQSIWNLISEIGSSLKTVWTNGTGEKIIGNMLGIFTNINNIISNISDGLAEAWAKNDTGTKIIQSLADIFNDILEDINKITADIADWADGLDFSPILTGFEGVLEELEPLIDNIGDMVEETVKGIVLPSIKLLIEVVAPAALKVVQSALQAINALIKPIKDNLSYINDNVIKPLISLISGVLKIALDKISEAFQMIADKVNEHAPQIQTVIQGVSDVLNIVISVLQDTLLPVVEYVFTIAKNTIGGFVDTILNIIDGLASVIDFVKAVFAGDWGKAWESIKNLFNSMFIAPVKKLWNNLKGFMLAIWNAIKGVFSGVAKWFGKIFGAAVTVIKNIWSGIKQFFSGIWSGIKSVFSAVGAWFSSIFTTAYNGVKKAFTGIGTWFSNRWTDIKNVFKSIKTWFSKKFTGAVDGIKEAFGDISTFFSGIWDGISSGFTGFINVIIDGINWLIGKINGISISAPDWDWLPDNIQGKSWGFNIPEIPKLAQGAVIPPNSEFLAVLGDQKRGTNIEAPLDTIKQALLEALVAYGGTNGNNQKVSLTVPVTLNGRVLTQLVIDNINDYIKCNGKSPINA